jgi:hypothetical protein
MTASRVQSKLQGLSLLSFMQVEELYGAFNTSESRFIWLNVIGIIRDLVIRGYSILQVYNSGSST